MFSLVLVCYGLLHYLQGRNGRFWVVMDRNGRLEAVIGQNVCFRLFSTVCAHVGSRRTCRTNFERACRLCLRRRLESGMMNLDGRFIDKVL